jgi:glycogen operon protein
VRFFSRLIAFRKRHPAIHRPRFFTGETNARGLKDVEWHGTSLGSPDWSDGGARVLAYTLAGFGDDPDLHVMMNMYWEPLDFAIPSVTGRQWCRIVDTSLPSPDDVAEPGGGVAVSGDRCRVDGRSIVVLENR